jgi:hypothetical protein
LTTGFLSTFVCEELQVFFGLGFNEPGVVDFASLTVFGDVTDELFCRVMVREASFAVICVNAVREETLDPVHAAAVGAQCSCRVPTVRAKRALERFHNWGGLRGCLPCPAVTKVSFAACLCHFP